jgi:GTPase SAR1 family protein
MTTYFYEKSRKEKKKIKRKSFFQNLKSLILPLTSHFGSVVSIFALKFLNSGKFVFDARSSIDWIIAVFLILIMFAGSRIVLNKMSLNRTWIVNREELEHLITVERFEAENSIYSICGDLSWLDRDRDILKEISQIKKNLTIKILYNSVSDKTKFIMNDLMNFGIEFIKYEKFDERLNCNYILVDLDTDNRKPIVKYRKEDYDKGEDKFSWSVESVEENSALAFVKQFILINDVNSSVPIKVGFCGVNNVGKTSLLKELESELTKRYKVKLFDDEFEYYKSIDTYSNLTILHKQLIKQQYKGDKLCLYDRTSIDNYAFFKCRSKMDKFGSYPSEAKIITDYYEEVNRSMDELDLLVMITNNERSGISTTFVDVELKDNVNQELMRFFKQFKNKNRQTLQLDFSNMEFDQSIIDARDKVCASIKEIATSKNKARVRLQVDQSKNEKTKESKKSSLETVYLVAHNVKTRQKRSRNFK